MEAIFKPIEAKDIPVVVRMMADFYAIDNYPIDKAISEGLLAEFTANENLGKGWLIMNNDEPVGYIILTFIFSFEYKGTVAILDELYIKDNARGKGLGKKALDFIQEQAGRYSVKIMYLEVEPHNEKAKQLYLSKGFKVHERLNMKWINRQ